MTVQARRHAPFNSHDLPPDVEKISHATRRASRHGHRISDIESDGESLPSSPESNRPMLLSATRRAPAGPGFYRVPHRIMRWLCLGLFVALLFFIGTLFRFAFGSGSHHLSLGLQKPAPKPPAWESFPFLTRYHGGIRSLVARKDNVPEYPREAAEDLISIAEANGAVAHTEKRDARSAVPESAVFNPYPDYASEEYIAKYGEKRDCFLDADGTVRIPPVRHYAGVPRGFPDAVMGSNEMIGIRDDICFDRFGRLGPYGMGYGARQGGIGAGLHGDREGADQVWQDYPPVNFRKVNWATAQNRCVATNSHRFKPLPKPRLDRFVSMPVGGAAQGSQRADQASDSATQAKVGSDRLPRTAVVIRTWADFQYSREDMLYLRALITELTLLSGGEYTVHFLIHVKDSNLPIWSDDETYERVLAEALPEEFRGMGTLWSEPQMGLVYPGLEESWTVNLPVHGVYRSTFMPMQYFSYQHPEYDYYWNWEMDVRYTGHWYHLFDKVTSWARAQPRKGLWERNARFYVPRVHGSWEDFTHTVRVQTESGTNSPNNLWSAPKAGSGNNNQQQQLGDKSIWGPERPSEEDIMEVDGEGIPPTTMEKDRYEWGVGEDADLIVFNPLFDPIGTTWHLQNDVTGYNKTEGQPPRRIAIITASRLSRKLLHTMHKETALKRHTMFSEMWPASVALHHGFKAVYVPHSVYIDRRWPTKYLESVFNAGHNGASGGARTAVYGEREHNFRGTTWFYSAGFAPNLWRRWLGQKVDNDGGEEAELAGEGRMCLPPIMLHPVKSVELIVEDVLD